MHCFTMVLGLVVGCCGGFQLGVKWVVVCRRDKQLLRGGGARNPSSGRPKVVDWSTWLTGGWAGGETNSSTEDVIPVESLG